MKRFIIMGWISMLMSVPAAQAGKAVGTGRAALPDRAQALSAEVTVQDAAHRTTQILGVNPQCGRDLSSLSLLVTGASGAALLAKAYGVWFGETARNQVIEAWQNAQHRGVLPGFLWVADAVNVSPAKFDRAMLRTAISQPLRLGASCEAVSARLESSDWKPTRMRVDLLYPQGLTGAVEMTMDCGGELDRSALIVLNAQGAALLSEIYRTLYGEAEGERVWAQWQSKEQPEDPRLPTFLIIQAGDQLSSSEMLYKTDAPLLTALNLKRGCGTGGHDPNYGSDPQPLP